MTTNATKAAAAKRAAMKQAQHDYETEGRKLSYHSRQTWKRNGYRVCHDATYVVENGVRLYAPWNVEPKN